MHDSAHHKSPHREMAPSRETSSLFGQAAPRSRDKPLQWTSMAFRIFDEKWLIFEKQYECVKRR